MSLHLWIRALRLRSCLRHASKDVGTLSLEGCRIERLLDKRFHGIVKGVGEGKILGRVHSAPIQVGHVVLPSTSFTVIATSHTATTDAVTAFPDLLLGLDVMRRHAMVIDLSQMVMIIQGDSIPFVTQNQQHCQ